ncbi:hypothetical protein [Rahnella selenatireducens]|uniref:hypothetical protein n=1 Tax=Rahnella selenatireducens TaxID=3389797 RepID=UPI003968D2F1
MTGLIIFALGIYALIIGSALTLALWLCIKKINSGGNISIVLLFTILATFVILFIAQTCGIPVIS